LEILRGKLEILSAPGPALALDDLGDPRTDTKFTKWSVCLKRLRTAALENKCPDMKIMKTLSITLLLTKCMLETCCNMHY